MAINVPLYITFLARQDNYSFMPVEIVEILVPCPSCRKIHKVPVKEIKENREVKMPCGAILGSVGLMRRVEEAEKRAKEFKGPIYKLE